MSAQLSQLGLLDGSALNVQAATVVLGLVQSLTPFPMGWQTNDLTLFQCLPGTLADSRSATVTFPYSGAWNQPRKRSVNRILSPDPAGPLASPEAMPMHIDDIPTTYPREQLHFMKNNQLKPLTLQIII